MINRTITVVHRLLTFAVAIGLALGASHAARAQDRLKSMPGYAQFRRMAPEIAGAVSSGAVLARWRDSGAALEYVRGGKAYRYVLSAKREVVLPQGMSETTTINGRGLRFGSAGSPARGRQFESALAPDGKHRAFYRDRNLWIADSSGAGETPITTDGSVEARIKNGTASWVYGEELDQVTAFWWSPTGDRVAYYRFDESQVPDYYIALDQTKLQTKMDVEAYPKPGVPNPIVDLYVYDLATKKSTRIDVRDGKSFANDVVGHYVYHVAWTPDGRELTFNRTNRRQNVLELAACAPETGKCRAVIHEEWPTGWIENNPTMEYLADGKRFLWESERSGFKNYYLYDIGGKLLNAVTSLPAEVAGIVKVNEPENTLYYLARDGDNHLKLQLHRVRLDGKNDRRLTDPAFHHAVVLSPDGKHFVDIAQTHDQPPSTSLRDIQGRLVAVLARSDLARFDSLGFRRAEMFTYKAADGVTTLRGLINFPSHFDSTRKYPVLVSVYGGPASASNTARETFVMPNAFAEYGFIVLNLDSRAAPGMGKRVLDALYLKLGRTEIDDMALGVKALWNRPFIDRARVGIYGTSYGGYASLMELLRYPDVFAAASSSSPPTDWRNYDTIYTERYMWIPQENAAGYDAGSAMTYADSLRGRLMLYWGTADNNVHPSNMMQLVAALQRAGKSVEMQVGPDRGHSGLNADRMMEFFIDALVLNPPRPAGATTTF